MKRIASSILVAGTIGAALLGTAGTAAAAEAPLLPMTFPNLGACVDALERLEAQENVRGVYGCYPTNQRDMEAPTILRRK